MVLLRVRHTRQTTSSSLKSDQVTKWLSERARKRDSRKGRKSLGVGCLLACSASFAFSRRPFCGCLPQNCPSKMSALIQNDPAFFLFPLHVIGSIQNNNNNNNKETCAAKSAATSNGLFSNFFLLQMSFTLSSCQMSSRVQLFSQKKAYSLSQPANWAAPYPTRCATFPFSLCLWSNTGTSLWGKQCTCARDSNPLPCLPLCTAGRGRAPMALQVAKQMTPSMSKQTKHPTRLWELILWKSASEK